MSNCWLSSELGSRVSRTSDALEQCNKHVKANFAENLLLPVNEFFCHSVYGHRKNQDVLVTRMYIFQWSTL